MFLAEYVRGKTKKISDWYFRFVFVLSDKVSTVLNKQVYFSIYFSFVLNLFLFYFFKSRLFFLTLSHP